MRAAHLIVASLFAGLAGSTAIAAPGPTSPEPSTCDARSQALVRVLGRLPGSAALRVTKASDRIELVDTATRKVVLEVACAGLKIPLADALRRPVSPRDAAATRADGPYVVSLTARGVVSLSVPAGLAAAEAIEVVVFDDDSVSITDERGRTWYSVAHRDDGTRVEVEGAHAGCGCERTVGPDGRTSERRL